MLRKVARPPLILINMINDIFQQPNSDTTIVVILKYTKINNNYN